MDQPLQFQEARFGSDDYHASIELRYEALRKPLGMHYTPDQLEAEKNSWHLVCKDRDSVVACLVLKPEDFGIIRMRQFAVRELLQGKGVGRFLAMKAENLARKRGFTEIVLHAREAVIGFYEKLGFVKEGERFTEVTLPHFRMRKKL
jgi:predicted GNAT family N-acyltransferase